MFKLQLSIWCCCKTCKKNLHTLNIPKSLFQTHIHTAYWSLGWAVAWAAPALSSAEFRKTKQKQHNLTGQNHINMELGVNRSHQPAVKLRETADPLSWVLFMVWPLDLLGGSSSVAYCHWCFSLTRSKVCSQILVHTNKIQNDLHNRSQSSHRSPLMNPYPHLAVLSLWWWHHALPENSVESKYKGNEHCGCNCTRDDSTCPGWRALCVRRMSDSCSWTISLLNCV